MSPGRMKHVCNLRLRNIFFKLEKSLTHVSSYRDSSVESEVSKKSIKFERIFSPDKQSGIQDSSILYKFIIYRKKYFCKVSGNSMIWTKHFFTITNSTNKYINEVHHL